jgi:hypothetical protein
MSQSREDLVAQPGFQTEPAGLTPAQLHYDVIDAIAVPVTHFAQTDRSTFDHAAFVGEIIEMPVSTVRGRIDMITGWRGIFEDRPLAWDTDGLRVNYQNNRAQTLLGATAIKLDDRRLPMELLQDFVEDRLVLEAMMRASAAERRASIGKLLGWE